MVALLRLLQVRRIARALSSIRHIVRQHYGMLLKDVLTAGLHLKMEEEMSQILTGLLNMSIFIHQQTLGN